MEIGGANRRDDRRANWQPPTAIVELLGGGRCGLLQSVVGSRRFLPVLLLLAACPLVLSLPSLWRGT